MSDSSQMRHPQTTLSRMKTSGRAETRELFLGLSPLVSKGSIHAVIGLLNRKQGATPGDADRAIVNFQAIYGHEAPGQIQ
ncbi:uncharacterized protein N7515_007997 [Penicillium bovifimosum]|uniref:Uncharacterized protein n=1 Tax=Penicillium bovifimosum TaxID=126998 RepID=A0A9W9GNA1_9EURO|nr:uncharacterized protein N7515_007997 [Penicillium bovifimosum]KAJ5124172.1 hypothetical protein N7515_007997 [Penicillium bovifimosum]